MQRIERQPAKASAGGLEDGAAGGHGGYELKSSASGFMHSATQLPSES
jgi:hypothetical protein